MKKYDLSDSTTFEKVKKAAIWLLQNTQFKNSAIYHFFGIHKNSLTHWKKAIDSGKNVHGEKNEYVEDFLKSRFNNVAYKKFNNLDVDMVGEIKWVILNLKFPRYIVADFYSIDDNYISQLKSGYAWESISPVEPNAKRKKEIHDGLETIETYIKEEIESKKAAVAWLLLYSELELLEISHLLELNYLHVYRVKNKGKNDSEVWKKMSESISNIIYRYDFSTGEYHYNIIRK